MRAFAGFQEGPPSIVHARSHRPPSAPSLPDLRWSSLRKHRRLLETVSAIQDLVPFTLQKLHHFLRRLRLDSDFLERFAEVFEKGIKVLVVQPLDSRVSMSGANLFAGIDDLSSLLSPV